MTSPTRHRTQRSPAGCDNFLCSLFFQMARHRNIAATAATTPGTPRTLATLGITPA